MSIYTLKDWPNYIRWLLFLPISIIVALIYALISYLTLLRFGGIKILVITLGLIINYPLMTFVGMYIVPKFKKMIGYLYISLYILALSYSIIILVKGLVPVNLYEISQIIGSIIGIIITIFVIHNYEEVKRGL